MTVEETADRFIQMFGSAQKAYEYAILWQDEYITDSDKKFRREVLEHLNNKQ